MWALTCGLNTPTPVNKRDLQYTLTHCQLSILLASEVTRVLAFERARGDTLFTTV